MSPSWWKISAGPRRWSFVSETFHKSLSGWGWGDSWGQIPHAGVAEPGGWTSGKAQGKLEHFQQMSDTIWFLLSRSFWLLCRNGWDRSEKQARSLGRMLVQLPRGEMMVACMRWLQWSGEKGTGLGLVWKQSVGCADGFSLEGEGGNRNQRNPVKC